MISELSGTKWVLLVIIAAINILAFILYFIDKQRAIKRKYRISEKTLLLSSFLLGGIGAWLGMTTFRHKTQHSVFKFGLPVAAIVTLITVFSLLT